jgi:hypothetical protein
LLAGYTREIIEELVKGITSFEIIKQSQNRDTSADEDRRTAEDVGIAVDYG